MGDRVRSCARIRRQADSCNYPTAPDFVRNSLLLNTLYPINENGSVHRSVDTAGEATYGILGKSNMSGRLIRTKDWEKLAKEANFRPAEMAAICRISLRQLERHFGKEFKSTPKEWMRQFRCRLALKLIMEGYSNKAAASELKFGNPSHLCHEFRKVYGSSPQTYTQSKSEPRDVAFRQ
jgi:AraC-like DNA-binding protein